MKKALTYTFILLYLAVGFISFYHAIAFFGIANEDWMATVLAAAFEIGQAVVLLTLLVDPDQSKKPMPWALMIVLTIVQCLGNIFSSYQYMVLNSQDQIKYFTESVLFYISDPDPQVNTVMISYIVGAILPIVALCMTGMVANVSGLEKKSEELENVPELEEPKPEPENSKIFL